MKIIIEKSVEEFILSLEKTTIARTLRVIDLLQEFDYKMGMPHAKKVSKDLFELRISGRQEIRIFILFMKIQFYFCMLLLKNHKRYLKGG
jgi:hypothetical protein